MHLQMKSTSGGEHTGSRPAKEYAGSDVHNGHGPCRTFHILLVSYERDLQTRQTGESFYLEDSKSASALTEAAWNGKAWQSTR